MRRILGIIWILLLTILVSCNKEEVKESLYEPGTLKLSYSNTFSATGGLRVFLFNTDQKLVEEQVFTSYPTTLYSPAGRFYMIFVGNAGNSNDIPELTTGVTTMNDVLHQLKHTLDGINYQAPAEYWLYVTPTPVELHKVSSLQVDFKRSVGALEFIFTVPTGHAIKAVYANITCPVEAINFQGETVRTASNGAIRQQLLLDTDGKFKGNMICLPQTNALVSYDVIYTAGTSETYSIILPVKIEASKITSIQSSFSGQVNSTIGYLTWDHLYTIDYYVGFQVNVAVEGGNPDNYISATVTIQNISVIPNVSTTYTNLPLVNINGVLMFDGARFIGNGTYVLTSILLADRDGNLSDPNQRGTNLAVGFSVPGKAAAVKLDGRQNEEEYYVRKAIVTMHGTSTVGSIYPGTSTYATRCIPITLPTSSDFEGKNVNRWPQTTPGGNIYAIITRVINSEWRVVAFSFENNTYVFNDRIVDTRFQSGGGSVPKTDFYPFLYLESVAYAKIDLKYGNDISGYANIRNLNTFVMNNSNVLTANKYSGNLPITLSTKDMIRFEINYSNAVGTLPIEYSNWKKLNILHFINNTGLTGPLPKEYANFKQLTLFRILTCDFTGQIPQEFNNYAGMNVGINFNFNRFTCAPQAFFDRYTVNVATQQAGTIGYCSY